VLLRITKLVSDELTDEVNLSDDGLSPRNALRRIGAAGIADLPGRRATKDDVVRVPDGRRLQAVSQVGLELAIRT
jgi:hypothetical protein